MQGYKDIAVYLSDRTRELAGIEREYTDEQVRDLARRAVDPLPVKRYGRRGVYGDEATIDAWIVEEKARSERRRAPR